MNGPASFETRDFTLDGTAQLDFAVPVGPQDSLVSFGIYMPSGRSVLLDTVRLRVASGDVLIYPDKGVYRPGETVLATVLSQVDGVLNVSATGDYTNTLVVTADDTQTFTFDLPLNLTAGTYYIVYELEGGEAQQAAFEVVAPWAGVVKVELNTGGTDFRSLGDFGSLSAVTFANATHVRSAVGPVALQPTGPAASTVQVGATFTIEANQEMPGTLVQWEVQDPEGTTLGTWEFTTDLAEGQTLIELPVHSFDTAWNGTHYLVYQIRWQNQEMASGMAAFDVEGAVLLGLTTDRTAYRTNQPVLATANTLGQGTATLTLFVDGE